MRWDLRWCLKLYRGGTIFNGSRNYYYIIIIEYPALKIKQKCTHKTWTESPVKNCSHDCAYYCGQLWHKNTYNGRTADITTRSIRNILKTRQDHRMNHHVEQCLLCNLPHHQLRAKISQPCWHFPAQRSAVLSHLRLSIITINVWERFMLKGFQSKMQCYKACKHNY